MQGHDLGHGGEAQGGAGWGALIEAHVADFGGYAAFADELVHRLARVADAPRDRQTVEKGLRRLAGRGSKAGGQYGRWVLRYFGVPTTTRRWLAWLGQYHSRFADLPTSLRLEQLRLWERPPISESPQLIWIHLGLASVWMRSQKYERAWSRLRQAQGLAPKVGGAAALETCLLHARLLVERERQAALTQLDRAGELLDTEDLTATEQACYRARLEAQRAYLHLHPKAGETLQLEAAATCASSIPTDSGLPFVDFRRAELLAYCARERGHFEQARTLATEAASHAADGGLVRFRVMALKLLASTWKREGNEDQHDRVRAHAQRLARLLEDEDLLQRLNKQPQQPPE